MASARADSSPGAYNRPSTPSVTISGIPPISGAKTGQSAARASKITSGAFSGHREPRTNALADASMAETSVVGPSFGTDATYPGSGPGGPTMRNGTRSPDFSWARRTRSGPFMLEIVPKKTNGEVSVTHRCRARGGTPSGTTRTPAMP